MYQAADTRYDGMTYNRCGSSGLRLPAVSLGFWHNFGSTGVYETMRKLCFTAFDNGVTHFDLANNYGPEPPQILPHKPRYFRLFMVSLPHRIHMQPGLCTGCRY